MLLLMKNINIEMNASSKKKEIDCHDRKSYWETIIIEYIQGFPFINTMEHTEDNIENQITLLLSLLILVFAIFNMRLWYDNENSE